MADGRMARRPPRDDAAGDPHRDPQRGADPRWSERRDGGSARGSNVHRRTPSDPRGPRTEPYATPNDASDATRELARQPIDPREAGAARPGPRGAASVPPGPMRGDPLSTRSDATDARGIPPVGRVRQPRIRRRDPAPDAPTNGYGYPQVNGYGDRPTTDFSRSMIDQPTVDGLPRVPGRPGTPDDLTTTGRNRPVNGYRPATGEPTTTNGYPPPRPPNFSGPDYGMPPPSGIPYGAPYGAPPGQPAPTGRPRETPYRQPNQPFPPPGRDPGREQPTRDFGPARDRPLSYGQQAAPGFGQPPGHGQTPSDRNHPGRGPDYGQPRGFGQPPGPATAFSRPPGPGHPQPDPGHGHGHPDRGYGPDYGPPGPRRGAPPPYGRPNSPIEQQPRIPRDRGPDRGPDDGVTPHETGRWSSSRGMWMPAEPREEPPGFAIERFEETTDLRRNADRGRSEVIDAADWTERLDQRPEWHPHTWDDAPTSRSTDWSESPLPPPPPNRRVMDVEPERDPVASELMGERVPAGTVSAALAPLAWFALAIAAYLGAVFLFNDGAERAEALDAGVQTLPWLGVASTMSVGLALVFRWIGAGWKAAGLGFAAAVVSGTLTTVLNSLIFG